jgi:L-threonylcarbamoyladenylate synthase
METDIKNAVKVLENGGVILYPTDTIWGIGCDATNKYAVEKIFQIKRREKEKSMIVLIESIDELKKYVGNVPSIAYELIADTDRPLTLIYSNAMNLAENIIAVDGSVAARIPDHEFCQRLLKTFGKPIVSTSANFSGDANAVSFDKISAGLLPQVDYIVQIMHNVIIDVKPSRILKLNNEGGFKIIRD